MDEFCFFFDPQQTVQETVREEPVRRVCVRARLVWINPLPPLQLGYVHRVLTPVWAQGP